MSTAPWAAVERLVNDRLDELHQQLETCSPDALRHIQGQIAGLRFTLNIPTRVSGDEERRISD